MQLCMGGLLMFANIHDLREILSMMIYVIDERNELLEENIKLREKLMLKEQEQMEMYRQNMSATADILNIMIERAEKG